MSKLLSVVVVLGEVVSYSLSLVGFQPWFRPYRSLFRGNGRCVALRTVG